MCWDGEDGERGFVDVRDLGEVEGDSVEKEVGVSSTIVDADKALEILVESLRLGIALSAVEVPQNGGWSLTGGSWRYCVSPPPHSPSLPWR